MTKVSFDYETRSEADLKKVGAWAYSQHPSTEVLCMSYAYDDGNPWRWKPGKDIPNFLDPIEGWGHHELHAWNSFFEYCITLNTLKLEPAPIRFWFDTMARAAAMGLPGKLGDCAEALGLTGDKGKDKRGKKLIQLLSIPQKNSKKKVKEGAPEFYWNNDPILLNEMEEYCDRDVEVERAVGRKLLNLSPFERELWILDQEINIRGVQVDSPMIDHCIQIYEDQSKVTMAELKELTGLENPNSGTQFLPWLKSIGYTEDNLQADTLKEFLKGIEK